MHIFKHDSRKMFEISRNFLPQKFLALLVYTVLTQHPKFWRAFQSWHDVKYAGNIIIPTIDQLIYRETKLNLCCFPKTFNMMPISMPARVCKLVISEYNKL